MDDKSRRDLLKLTDTELQKALLTAREALYKLKFQKVVEEVTDISQVRKTKRKIARINTILAARQKKASETAKK